MGMQMVHHEPHLLHRGRILLNQCFDTEGPLYCCALCSHFCISLTCSWLKSHKHICSPMALLLCSISQRLSRFSRERRTNFAHELGRHLIDTSLGTMEILWSFINISAVFHLTDKGRMVLWRNTPCWLLPGFKGRFFKVRRTVAGAREATIAPSTILSASMRQVHRSCPSGA